MLNISYDGDVSPIKWVLGAYEDTAESAAEEESSEEGDWDALLDELRRAIDGFDSDAAQTVMDKAQGLSHDGRPCSEIFKKVFDALKEYDFMAASEALEEIGGGV